MQYCQRNVMHDEEVFEILSLLCMMADVLNTSVLEFSDMTIEFTIPTEVM